MRIFCNFRRGAAGQGTNCPRRVLSYMTRKKSPNWFDIGMDAWMLGAEANMVVAMRLGTMAMGGPAAAREAERMLSEKVAANMKLGMDIATGKHGSTPEQVMSGSLKHYSRSVTANRKRLAKVG